MLRSITEGPTLGITSTTENGQEISTQNVRGRLGHRREYNIKRILNRVDDVSHVSQDRDQ
jgi:hypothetical protein